MGALIFYTFVYAVGHYATLILNTLMKRKLLNHRWVGFAGVIIVAIMHADKIINSVGHEDETAYAISYFVIFPVVVIAIVLVYLNEKDKKDKNNNDPTVLASLDEKDKNNPK
jgi:uncharacterized membrane protein AbrB (regulator of aidB expression)